MRYALFYTPPANHDLTRRAAEWLGRDAYSGSTFEQQAEGTFSAARLNKLTAAPRRYGFHATLKAPFQLSQDTKVSQLTSALERYCSGRETFIMPKLKVARLGAFFALVPDNEAPEKAVDDLNSFAADIVRQFESFRAPLSEADIARRNPDKLGSQQRTYLQQWGYPYIFDAFRFHMTLTGAVPENEADEIEDILKALFDPLLQPTMKCDHLTLFKEAEKAAPFSIKESFPLASPLTTKASSL